MLPIPSRYIVVVTVGHHPPVHSLQVYNDFILSLGCCPYPADTLLWLLWATIHLCIHYRFIMTSSYLWGAAHTQQIHCCGDSGPPSTCVFTTGLYLLYLISEVLPIPSRYIVVVAVGHHPPVYSLQVYNDFILSLGCCPYPADTLLWLLWATIHMCIHYRFIMTLSYLWGAAHTQQIHCCGDSGPPSTCAFTTGL